jgi:hypothetical protein
LQNKKIIVIFCHSRAELLNKCFNSLKKANGIDSWKVTVVNQKGFTAVEKIIKRHSDFINNLIITEPIYGFPLGNINNNRILGTKFAFEVLGAEYLLGIEEDNLISVDALDFIDFVYKKYKDNNAFRGINLGSVEYGKKLSGKTYSLLRSGLHGSAGVLTRRTWNTIKQKDLLEFNLADRHSAWDGKIEFFLKSGFMVTPNLSRNLDLGHGGTFAPPNKSDPYFEGNRRSWYKRHLKQRINYEHSQIIHHIRRDAVGYRRSHNLFYLLRNIQIFYNLSGLIRIKPIIKKFLIPGL